MTYNDLYEFIWYSFCSYWFAMLCDALGLYLLVVGLSAEDLSSAEKKLTLWHGTASSQNRRQVFRNIFPFTHTEHRCGCVWTMWNLFWFFRFAIAFLLPLHYLYVYIQLYIIKKTPDGPRRHPLTVSDPHQRHIDTLIGGIGRRQDQFERGARTETRDRLQFQGAIAMHFPCISGG